MKREFEPILQSLNVKIVDEMNASENEKKNQALIHGKINGQEVLLKIVPKKDINKISGLKKEALVDNIIEKHNTDFPVQYINKAGVLSTGSNENYAWIIRRYYTGRALAKIKGDVVLMGYDILPNKYLLNRKEIINQIVNNLESFKTIKKDFGKVKGEQFPQRYESNLENYCIKEIEKGLTISLSDQVDFYNKNKAEYFYKDNICATVGDLVPANIILKEDNQIIFSDFEWFCFDNYLMDATFLWSFLWRYPDWQNDLLQLSVKDEQEKLFFRMSLIRQIIGKYSITFDPKYQKKLKRIEALKKHAWTEYLMAAGESFEAIIKVRK